MKKFTLGADPEFLCCDKNDGIKSPARPFLDSRNYNLDYFGLDGCGRIFELRPEPSEEPLEIVTHIKGILATQSFAKTKLLNQKWKSGSFHDGDALGGHIHFGHAPLNSSPERYCQFLTNYLGSILLLVEKTSEAIARRNTGYGGGCDYRTQNHGLEYRMPSSWLTSPHIAAATLCLSKVVGHEMINKPFKREEVISFRQISSVMKKEIRAKFPAIWEKITQMELYPKYAEYINLFKFLIDNKLTWYPKCSMQEAWGITDKHKNFTNKVTIESIWQNV